MFHGDDIGDRSLIGIGATVLANSRVGTESIVATGALVLEGFTVPDRTLVAGMPARVIREVTDDEVIGIVANAAACMDQVRLYLQD
jgi:carbonic anhydrase/acetyltransferase-like protein (isoleucine patch superfamily)